MINLLVLTMYNADCIPDFPIDPAGHHFINSLHKIYFLNPEIVYYDQIILKYNQQGFIDYILKLNNLLKFDIVLIRWQSTPVPANIEKLTFFKLKELLNLPFVFTWGDTYFSDMSPEQCPIGWFMSISDLNIYLDSPHYMINNGKSEFWPCIYDSGLFYNPVDTERNIDVCFNGSINNRKNRQDLIYSLNAGGIDVVYNNLGVKKVKVEHLIEKNLELNVQKILPIDQYVAMYKNSKISLNLSDNPNVLKGRIFEVNFSGSCLFSDYSSVSEMLFEPEKEYIKFDSSFDLIDKIEYYLNHDNERQVIAQAGQEKAIKLCESNKYWKKVIERVGLNID